MMLSEDPVFSTQPFEPIRSIRTIFDAMQVLRKTCIDYGFRYFSVIDLPIPISGGDDSISQLATISSWPPELIADYDRLGLAKNSPVLDRLRKQITPVLFEIESISNHRPGEETVGARELFRRFDVSMGVYFPVHDAKGLRHAVSFIGDRDPLTAVELATLGMFATFLIEQIAKVTNGDSAAKSVLNARETEVLQWTAEGKTSSDIARITGLSEHTVNHYAIIATQKLGCSNRTQAVVCAMRLGLFR